MVAVIPVGGRGDAEVDYDAGEGEYRAVGVERKDFAIQAQFVVRVGKL